MRPTSLDALEADITGIPPSESPSVSEIEPGTPAGNGSAVLRQCEILDRKVALHKKLQRLDLVSTMTEWARNMTAATGLFIFILVVVSGICNLLYGLPLVSDKVLIAIITCGAVGSIVNLLTIVFKYVFK